MCSYLEQDKLQAGGGNYEAKGRQNNYEAKAQAGSCQASSPHSVSYTNTSLSVPVQTHWTVCDKMHRDSNSSQKAPHTIPTQVFCRDSK